MLDLDVFERESTGAVSSAPAPPPPAPSRDSRDLREDDRSTSSAKASALTGAAVIAGAGSWVVLESDPGEEQSWISRPYANPWPRHTDVSRFRNGEGAVSASQPCTRIRQAPEVGVSNPRGTSARRPLIGPGQ